MSGPGGTSASEFMAPTYDAGFSSSSQSDATSALLRDPETGGMAMRSDAASAAGGDDQAQGGLLGGFCGCLSVRYYQPYFDVDTAHVADRIKFALFPFKREEGFIQLLGPNPDAYGPFWIATTLVFAIAVVSNLSSYFGFTPAEEGAKWTYDFAAVVTCATVVYGFAALVPALLWAGLRYMATPLPLIQTIAIYGYSLCAFIPFTLLNFVPNNSVPWLSEVLASGASTVFLLKALGPTVREKAPQQAIPFLAALGATQVALAMTIKLVFFHNAA